MPNYTVQDLKDNLDYLAETKRQIKEALINKGQSVSNSDTFRSYVGKINNIGNSATASADDVVQGYTAYINNEVVGGNIVPHDSISTNASYPVIDDSNSSAIIVKGDFNLPQQGYLLRDNNQNATVQVSQGYSGVASAIGLTANKIMKGSTILGIEGTATDDANALPGEIKLNKTAYINGQKITGTLDTSIFIVPNGVCFAYSTAKDIPPLDTSGVINMSNMFSYLIR